MKYTTIPLLLVTINCSSLHAQGTEEKRAPVTLSQALELGPEKLATVFGEDTSDLIQAKELYATAKRIDTEHALAERDLELVIHLEGWRLAISDCRQGSLDLAATLGVGGSRLSSLSAVAGMELEDFLSTLGPHIPVPYSDEGQGSPKAAKQIGDAIAIIKKLKVGDLGDADSTEFYRAKLPAEVKRVTEKWEILETMIATIPAEDAEKIAAFATASLKWIK